METQVTMTISPAIYYRKARIRLWEDPCYSRITFSTPDVVEKSLIQAVENGEAEYALDWYLQQKVHNNSLTDSSCAATVK